MFYGGKTGALDNTYSPAADSVRHRRLIRGEYAQHNPAKVYPIGNLPGCHSGFGSHRLPVSVCGHCPAAGTHVLSRKEAIADGWLWIDDVSADPDGFSGYPGCVPLQDCLLHTGRGFRCAFGAGAAFRGLAGVSRCVSGRCRLSAAGISGSGYGYRRFVGSL